MAISNDGVRSTADADGLRPVCCAKDCHSDERIDDSDTVAEKAPVVKL